MSSSSQQSQQQQLIDAIVNIDTKSVQKLIKDGVRDPSALKEAYYCPSQRKIMKILLDHGVRDNHDYILAELITAYDYQMVEFILQYDNLHDLGKHLKVALLLLEEMRDALVGQHDSLENYRAGTLERWQKKTSKKSSLV